MRLKLSIAIMGMLLLIVIVAFKDKQNSPDKLPFDKFRIDTVATNLTVPWAIVFLPDKSMLFTERNGKVRLYRNGKLIEKPVLLINNSIDTTKKMGLLGICLHPAFTTNHFIYVANNYRSDGKPLLRVMRYEFSNDSLINPITIIDNINGSPNHTGCRLRFGPDNKLYITTGDADRPINAQDLKSLNGKILRLNDDGTVPADNPFVKNDTARKEIWTYGHRNPQGIDFQPVTNLMYESEHGPTGGDEVNVIYKGFNYGWPVIHHQDKKDGMIMPLLEYTPSIGPAELVFYSANAFPDLKGNILLASLRGEAITRIILQNGNVIFQEKIINKQYGRIRAITVGPDGFVYFSTSQNDPPEGTPRDGYDMILRMRPSAQRHIGIKDSAVNNSAIKKMIVDKTPKGLYVQLCASCHGLNLEGSERAKSMMDDKWDYGGTKQNIIKSIQQGIIEKGMPAWDGAVSQKDIVAITDYIIARNKKKK